jgi:hypothetical protein
MRLARAEPRDAEWLADTLNEICEEYGRRFDLAGDGTLTLRPAGAARPPSPA